MKYYDYSPNQLEQKAEELLRDFDSERLTKAKPIDVYAVIEKCLDVPYDWKYITPDQSILGMTAFNEGTIWVWPEPKYYEGLMPEQIYLEKGTILIDATLTQGDNRGRENFTVMHEVFHQVLHKKCFRNEGKNYIHSTYSRTIDDGTRLRYASYALYMAESQANACAAAFLMPADLVEKTYRKKYHDAGLCKYNHNFVDSTIKDMAKEFNVSKQAMAIRLQVLGLIDENNENLIK